MEQQALYTRITSPLPGNSGTPLYPAGGPVPWDGNYGPWNFNRPDLICPSEVGVWPVTPNGLANANYGFCIGDSTSLVNSRTPRGIFGYQTRISIANITDGTSNTVSVSEMSIGESAQSIHGGVARNIAAAATTPSACLAMAENGLYTSTASPSMWRGQRWMDGAIFYAAFNTVLPPNSPSCSKSTWDGDQGVSSVTSYHPAGVVAGMADASVRFVSDNVNCGNSAATGVTLGASPYGVWGAMGSKTGGEGATIGGVGAAN